MSDDLAVPQLDEPAVEPAPATSGPARVTHLLGRLHRDRGGLPALAGWLLVVIAAFGLLVSTPPSAGPDEQTQQVTAWYLSGHGLRPDGDPVNTVPAQLLAGPCFIRNQSQSAGCMAPRSAQMINNSLPILDYPPFYYWVVGAGERLAAQVGLEYADVGGRLASIILSYGTLLLVTLYMRRRNQLWGNFLLLVSTPTAVFFGIVVNPSGWEITCGIAMAAILAEAAWGRLSSIESEAWPKSTIAMLALTSIGLCTARPIGFVWAAGLTISAIVLAPSIRRRGLLRIVCAVAPGIAVGAIWYRTHPYGAVTPSTLPGLVQGFVDTFMYFPEYISHMFGVLGYLDQPMPGMLLVLNISAWAVLLTRLPSIRKAAIVCGIGGIVVVPCAISATTWVTWPLWWQGRYGMPFACGFMLLLLLRSGRLIPRTISAVSGISLLTLGIMVWLNEIRYGFGLDGFGLPVQLQTPGMSPVRLGISAVLGLLLVLVSGYLLVKAWRSKPDFALSNEPEQLLTPSESDADYVGSGA